jgi:16S rRNA (guanine966-N2)-methyltransferase
MGLSYHSASVFPMNKSLPPGHVRIIAGQWRGSKLPVLDVLGLRPSSDRVRETLFNWLQQQIAGKRVLDLFAGTGALGFEAASRGAAEVLMIERDPRLVDILNASANKLKAENIRVLAADALSWLSSSSTAPFDIVFIDPPFTAELWNEVMAKTIPKLAPLAWVYVESSHSATLRLPPSLHLHREGKTRQVCYRLYRYQPA